MSGSKRIKRILADFLSDYLYVNLLFWKTYRRFPNLKNPRTFDEKIQWYKLYHRSPLMTRMADKYEVRSYLNEIGYSEILIDLYGVYDNAEAIDPAKFPDRFVMKATHGSGMNLICRDKSRLDWSECRNTMNGWLKQCHYSLGREWAYKDIRPRLVCERHIENAMVEELIDYKFYCYNGKPAALFICTNRFKPGGVRYDAFDMNWHRIPVCKGKPSCDLAFLKPENLKEMIQVASVLSKGFPFVRVDLYAVNGKTYFGEFTFYPDMGVVPFTPDHYNLHFGDLFILPEKRL
jgi:hypothetical protein